MTATATVVRVLRSSGGGGTGGAGGVVECESCGVALRPVDDVDADVALGTYLQHHPDAPEAVHRPDVPGGWSAVAAPG